MKVTEVHVFAAAVAWLAAVIGAALWGTPAAVVVAFGAGAVPVLILAMAATYPGAGAFHD